MPLVFPPLTKLKLGGAAHGWLSLFQSLEYSIPAAHGTTPLSQVKKSLKSLDVEDTPGLIINVSFASAIHIFPNLVRLGLGDCCRSKERGGQCTFRLNNDSVTQLDMALPQLETLSLGRPCAGNTCVTTVVSLLPISVHCVKLKNLAIHFNTTSIVEDFKNISMDPQFQKLRSLPRCILSHLCVDWIPLALDDRGFGAVADGMFDIFPSLECCLGSTQAWREVSCRIARLRGM